MIVAIIPARGGSKRIPGKNIRNFAGKPIISYSIEAAEETGIFDRIIVSTDSEEIAQVAREYGAETPFIRPAEIADDYTGTDEVVLHALSWLKSSGCDFDYVCCIYPTAPLIRAEFIEKGFRLLKETGAATAFSVTTFSYPVFRSLRTNDAGRMEMIWPENYKKRSQDLPEAYHDAGQFYWADVPEYTEGKGFLSKDSVPVILPRYFVQDIDNEEDFKLAEAIVAMQDRIDGQRENRYYEK